MMEREHNFRSLVRQHLQLPESECIEVLERERRGVLSVQGDHGYPYGIPMNHYYDRESGCIYFHCGREGHRNDALARCDRVSFCVFDGGESMADSWIQTVRSVVVFGRAELIDDRQEVERITRKLCYKFTDDEKYIQTEIKNYAAETLLIKLTPEHICGKRVKEA